MTDVPGTASRKVPLVERLAHALALIGGVMTLAIAAMVTVSVLGRWLGFGNVSGDFELVQMGTALTVFCYLPICQLKRGNVFVDTFSQGWSTGWQSFFDRLWDSVYMLLGLVIAWRLFVGGLDALRTNTATMVLALPTGWPILLAAVLAGFLTLVCLLTVVAPPTIKRTEPTP